MFVSKAIFLSFTELPSDIALALTFSYKRSETAAPCSKKTKKTYKKHKNKFIFGSKKDYENYVYNNIT